MQKGVLRIVDGNKLSFYCPGCKCHHPLAIRPAPSPSWEFNGNYDAPTFRPSVLVTWDCYLPGDVKDVCHSFVTDGQIQFLGDCTHELAGKTVKLAPRPASGDI